MSETQNPPEEPVVPTEDEMRAKFADKYTYHAGDLVKEKEGPEPDDDANQAGSGRTPEAPRAR